MEGALCFRAYADALETLPLLRAQGYRLVVVSNWDVSLSGVLHDARVLDVNAVLTSAQVGAAKPDPAIFEAALALAGVAAEQAVHVGDSPAQDVEGARAAGVPAVWLCRGEPRRRAHAGRGAADRLAGGAPGAAYVRI